MEAKLEGSSKEVRGLKAGDRGGYGRKSAEASWEKKKNKNRNLEFCS